MFADIIKIVTIFIKTVAFLLPTSVSSPEKAHPELG